MKVLNQRDAIMALMKKYLLSKYISIIFVLATFMGSVHHHNDLKSHSDCQICTIQNTIADSDTPVETTYLQELSLQSEAVTTRLDSFEYKQVAATLHSRAPPKTS